MENYWRCCFYFLCRFHSGCLPKMKKFFTLKRGHVSAAELQNMDPKLMIVLGHFLAFCDSNSLPCKITNITNKFKQSKTSTHIDGRAVDISVRGWTDTDIYNARHYMESIAGHYGAISASDYKKRVFVYHDVGLGEHIHLQVFR